MSYVNESLLKEIIDIEITVYNQLHIIISMKYTVVIKAILLNQLYLT